MAKAAFIEVDPVSSDEWRGKEFWHLASIPLGGFHQNNGPSARLHALCSGHQAPFSVPAAIMASARVPDISRLRRLTTFQQLTAFAAAAYVQQQQHWHAHCLSLRLSRWDCQNERSGGGPAEGDKQI
jgi:hypothetical protein